jgi:hypothetical protein
MRQGGIPEQLALNEAWCLEIFWASGPPCWRHLFQLREEAYDQGHRARK